jgi:hypothetical protein
MECRVEPYSGMTAFDPKRTFDNRTQLAQDHGMKISDRSAGIIEKVGVALFVVGVAILAGIHDQYDRLPNYLRLAAFVPFAFSIPMVTVEAYRSGLSSLNPIEKGRAIAWLLVPFMVVGGVLVWYVVDPAAKA